MSRYDWAEIRRHKQWAVRAVTLPEGQVWVFAKKVKPRISLGTWCWHSATAVGLRASMHSKGDGPCQDWAESLEEFKHDS